MAFNMVQHVVPYCNLCTKKIQKRQKFASCSICKSLVHLKCNKNNSVEMENEELKIFLCLKCNEENFPFYNETHDQMTKHDSNHILSEDLKLFFKEMNNLGNQNNFREDNIDFSSLLNCKYIDIEGLNIKKVNGKTFSMIHLNIGSLSLHKDQLVSSLSQLKIQFDIIGITETKIKSNYEPIFDLSLEGYTHYHTPSEASKGGTLIYVLNKHQSKPRKNLETIMYKSKHLESTFIELVIPNKKNVIIGCVYRHPCMNLNCFNREHLTPLLEKINNKKHIFLLGDFNVDLMKTDEDNNTSEYFDIITASNFIPHITYPTRITSHSKTLIDNIFSNLQNFSQGFSANLTMAISDHLAQVLLIPLDTKFKAPKVERYKRNTKNFDREKFLLEVLEIDWNDKIQLNKNDPNLSFKQLYSTVDSLINKHMPLQKLTKKELKLKEKPWISKQISQKIAVRDHLLKKLIQAKDPNIKKEYETEYKRVRNQIINEIKVSKKNYYQNFLTNNTNNMKNTWKGIKSIISLKSARKSQPTSLLVNNTLITDPKKIANTFNKYFSSVGSSLQNKIHHHGKDFKHYLQNSNQHSFFVKPTNQIEVCNQIIALATNKAEGPTSIPTDILKLIMPSISQPLTDIINLSFTLGIYIDDLKLSKVIPIYKEKDSDLDFVNYRPISLLSNINKIIEKLMYDRLYTFLEKYNCIYELQYGFRARHSTNHCLLDLTENIRKTIDKNEYAVGVFVDLQKAFDTVDHNILLSKLSHYGIRGVSLNWFRSYLSNRSQFVTINGKNSETEPMSYGVPQGSVLGPLLFLIYINDLNQSIKYSTTRHFADDTNLLLTNSSLKQLKKHLNIDLSLMSNWLKANKISLNVSKTELLIFRHPNKQINYKLKVKLDGKRLYPSEFVKYLGLLIDSHLNWSFHTKSLASKLTRTIGMLSKIRHFVDKSTLRNIYFSIFSSILTYGCQIWGQHQILSANIKRIIKLQNKAVRVINFADFHAPSSRLYKASHIMKLKDLITLNNFLYVHDCLSGNIPSSLRNTFSYINTRHDYTTRISEKKCINLPNSRTLKYGINSINGQSARNWNFFQVILFRFSNHEPTRNKYKQMITSHFINSY